MGEPSCASENGQAFYGVPTVGRCWAAERTRCLQPRGSARVMDRYRRPRPRHPARGICGLRNAEIESDRRSRTRTSASRSVTPSGQFGRRRAYRSRSADFCLTADQAGNSTTWTSIPPTGCAASMQNPTFSARSGLPFAAVRRVAGFHRSVGARS